MERIAILDHANHHLYVEDISDADLEAYNGSEEDYIKDNYTFDGGWSWDYIVQTEYFPDSEDKDPIEVNIPSWKPSEEQLNSLDEVYKTHGANSTCRRVIFNLLNDLKKLL